LVQVRKSLLNVDAYISRVHRLFICHCSSSKYRPGLFNPKRLNVAHLLGSRQREDPPHIRYRALGSCGILIAPVNDDFVLIH
jgi:hypothetical protein